jgi:hypothetical protein
MNSVELLVIQNALERLEALESVARSLQELSILYPDSVHAPKIRSAAASVEFMSSHVEIAVTSLKSALASPVASRPGSTFYSPAARAVRILSHQEGYWVSAHAVDNLYAWLSENGFRGLSPTHWQRSGENVYILDDGMKHFLADVNGSAYIFKQPPFPPR